MSSDRDDKRRLGERIREARTRRGLSQAGLAEACGVSTETISRVERGEVWPGLTVAVAIAAQLHLTLDALVGTEKLPKSKLRPDVERVLRLVERLDPEVVGGLVALLRTLRRGTGRSARP
ncbi:MAG: helix-turn-helix transcriptional regulator [Deltaproteobacteria bacterium]|nr:helix-turn-helix transcriptional regulator [Deltaproteobacteria bacterium]